ncbi:type II toxin-antitoxin system death-on-curing family toxin [Caldalkalibacillus salinus]|uniref:type II toxin-antitoxin system death-on-curing family toxin n=1 Tax=Caldalkalibacillus salinus TaxID=2803787 RepID=UPI001923339F|nr:type II toxin-antitoxin system death-on-curing family toxin [Caldalkalibacillus salinus]
MRYVTIEEVITINKFVIKNYSPNEPIGVQSQELLESAVYRPQQTLFEQDAYPDIFQKAAALFESLVKNHPFLNANKRTAVLAMTQFLSYNGYVFKMATQKEIEDFTVDVANRNLSFEEITGVIKRSSKNEDER